MMLRLDVFLVNNGFAKSREKAKKLISEGKVYINDIMQTKASAMIDEQSAEAVKISGDEEKYISRGGYKLEKAIDEFGMDLTGKICLDVGASTGGFTDCMLKHGASKVYAIDVGKDQLSSELKNNPRVISMEKRNFRYMEKSEINDEIDFICVDVSFISLSHIVGPAYQFLKNGGKIVCLIKPQFEAGKEHIDKNGIVKDKKIHKMVIENVKNYISDAGFEITALTASPITGKKGNEEYLICATKP